jgi:hypothetical protein
MIPSAVEKVGMHLLIGVSGLVLVWFGGFNFIFFCDLVFRASTRILLFLSGSLSGTLYFIQNIV